MLLPILHARKRVSVGVQNQLHVLTYAQKCTRIETGCKFKVDECLYVYLFKTSGLVFVYGLFLTLE